MLPLSRDTAPLCCHCGQPIMAGEPRWAGDRLDRPWHYSCAGNAAQIVRYKVGSATLFFRAGTSPVGKNPE